MSLPANFSIPVNDCSPQVAAAINCIQQNYSSDMSVKSIADDIGCSYNTLRSKFWRETRFTMKEYLILVRLDRACELLRETSIPVKEISDMVGYPYESHFSCVFKRIVGAQPSVYRLSFQVARLGCEAEHE
ncbi:helix-turn-helix transcriptional regulator [Maridesulfovibrio sp.]|uniref:helix-turn-helix transcriptional regulator n=1 Tax=Maridesulfovibrio sp. TaxID=2795000 RepID=UPI0029F4E7F6|nr:AraC family transcriptional regulator [Maridesulfovibrio sp.]